MPVTISWYDADKTILLYTITGRWTLDDVERATVAFGQMQDHVPTYFIIDMTRSDGLPGGILAAEKRLFDHDDMDRTINIVVGASPLVAVFFHTLKRLNILQNGVLVDSMAAAETYIQQHRRQTRS